MRWMYYYLINVIYNLPDVKRHVTSMVPQILVKTSQGKSLTQSSGKDEASSDAKETFQLQKTWLQPQQKSMTNWLVEKNPRHHFALFKGYFFPPNTPSPHHESSSEMCETRLQRARRVYVSWKLLDVTYRIGDGAPERLPWLFVGFFFGGMKILLPGYI